MTWSHAAGDDLFKGADLVQHGLAVVVVMHDLVRRAHSHHITHDMEYVRRSDLNETDRLSWVVVCHGQRFCRQQPLDIWTVSLQAAMPACFTLDFLRRTVGTLALGQCQIVVACHG